MSKKPDTWMPFYVGDYLSATGRLTTEQHGAYLLILLDYWKNGPPPNDDAVLAALARVTLPAWRKMRPALIGFFEVRDGLLIQKRVEAERAHAGDITEERSKAGKLGGAGKWGSDPAKAGRALRSERMAEARRKGTHTDQEWAALVSFCGGSCVRCGSVERIVKDHITPIYQGGSDAIENLQPLCGRCNSSKGPDATDLRPDGWEVALQMPDKRLTKRVANASQRPAPSQPPSNKPHTSSLTTSRESEPLPEGVDWTADLALNYVCKAANWWPATDNQRAEAIGTINGWLRFGCSMKLILAGIGLALKRKPGQTKRLTRFSSTIEGMRRDELGGELPATEDQVGAVLERTTSAMRVR